MAYTLISSSLLDSTIWRESNPTKIVWITMLLMAAPDGIVEASIPGLAARAGVSIDDCEAALEVLMAPDFYSRNMKNEGRRISEVEGGWNILNYEIYRNRTHGEV